MTSGRLAMAALLASGLLVGEAFPQAATEGVLTHGLSSGAGSALGKTLGNALGNAANQMGNRLGQQTSLPAPRPRVPSAKATGTAGPTVPRAQTAVAPSSSGSLIASIQGGVSPTASTPANCRAVTKPATSTTAKSDTDGSPPAEQEPARSSRCALSQDSNSHPAVVNLQPAK
ncbi:MAG TPA: hypothetical protein VJS37_09560 [Terriglobales bacterium]|nr:hypothetical protein [Terriglobales bacterium]